MSPGVRRLLPWVLAGWFIALSAMRLAVIAPGGPGFDGRLYRSATVAWLNGGDPWSVVQGGVWFGAPPPSLLPMIPFALLPEPVAIAVLLVLCFAASAWAIRRLGLPWWWLAFPPLVDGMWNANPHVLVLPLLLLGLAPIAAIVKVYAVVVPAVRLELRALILTVIAFVATAPFVPWGTYVAEREIIRLRLDLTAGGGLGVWALDQPLLPLAVVVTLAAFWVLVRRERERAAWLAMPVFWPWTQWYYSSLAIPGVAGRPTRDAPLPDDAVTASAAIAAAILAIPLEGGPAAALAVLAFGPPVAARVRSALGGRRQREPRAHGTLPSPNP